MKTVKYSDIFKKKLEDIVSSSVRRAIGLRVPITLYGGFVEQLKAVDRITYELSGSELTPAARDYLYTICAFTLCRLMETEK